MRFSFKTFFITKFVKNLNFIDVEKMLNFFTYHYGCKFVRILFCNSDLSGAVSMSPSLHPSFLWSPSALRSLTKGVTAIWTKKVKMQKERKTKVPLTTFGVPASPCCFFMWLSRDCQGNHMHVRFAHFQTTQRRWHLTVDFSENTV